MKKLLVTGFEPFGGETVNSSWEAVKNLPKSIGDYTIYKRQLPVIFGEAARCVLEAAGEVSPDVILCVGQAGGRSAVTPERIAVNIRDARIPDNAGNRPMGEQCVPEGAAAYFATVPVMAMAEAVCRAGLPGMVSNSAGAFVCNDTLYTLLHHYQGKETHVGFIHLPWLPEQGTPSLLIGEMVRALTAIIEEV